MTDIDLSRARYIRSEVVTYEVMLLCGTVVKTPDVKVHYWLVDGHEVEHISDEDLLRVEAEIERVSPGYTAPRPKSAKSGAVSRIVFCYIALIRLWSCLRHLGPSRGWAYWCLQNAAIRNPKIAEDLMKRCRNVAACSSDEAERTVFLDFADQVEGRLALSRHDPDRV